MAGKPLLDSSPTPLPRPTDFSSLLEKIKLVLPQSLALWFPALFLWSQWRFPDSCPPPCCPWCQTDFLTPVPRPAVLSVRTFPSLGRPAYLFTVEFKFQKVGICMPGACQGRGRERRRRKQPCKVDIIIISISQRRYLDFIPIWYSSCGSSS